MNSNNLYGKVDEADQMRLDARRKTRKRVAVVAISSLILVIVVVAAVVGTTRSKDHKNNGNESQSQSGLASIKAVCDTTLYPDTCYSSLSPLVNSTNIQPDALLKLSVIVAIDELTKASALLELKNCSELLDLAIDHLNDTLSSATNVDLKTIGSLFDDLMTWLSAAGTYQQTCIDSFEENVSGYLQKSTELTSNCLAIIKGFSSVSNSYNQRRRLMSAADCNEAPEWISGKDRKLLQKTNLPAGIKANVVVAKDGSGRYKKISDALKAVPEKSKKRFVIYVKKGVYSENVRIEKTMWNVMMVGDGMDSTIVSGSLNIVDGTPTFQSATFGTSIRVIFY